MLDPQLELPGFPSQVTPSVLVWHLGARLLLSPDKFMWVKTNTGKLKLIILVQVSDILF